MTYIPLIEPQSSGTLSNYTVYSTGPILASSISANHLIFTTENYLGSFCVTDAWVHIDSLTPSDFSPINISFVVRALIGGVYVNIAYPVSSAPGTTQNISKPYANKFVQIPIVATSTSSGDGTTLNSNIGVYVNLATGGAYTAYINTFVGGFYSGAK